MSTLFSARQIVEHALRKVGDYGLNDQAADPVSLRLGLEWLDMVFATFAGTNRVWWLVPGVLTLPMVADTASYDLPASLGASYPGDGIQFPIEARLEDSGGNTVPFRLVRLDEWEAITDTDQTGTPAIGYLDRFAAPTLQVHPVPTDATYSVKLRVQTFAADIADKGAGDQATGLRAAWQEWAIYRLAAALGDGTVRVLSGGEINYLSARAAGLEARLLAFENREHVTGPPLSEPWGE